MDNLVSAGIQVYPDLAAVSLRAAAHLAQATQATVARHGRCTWALAGGGTPRTLYHVLARDYAATLPWAQIHLFWGDERYVPHEDPRSNYRMVREALLAQVSIPPENIHPMPTGYPTPDEAARAYENTLQHAFPPPRPRLDLVLLGIGTDGHTASLFPGTPALDEKERWVTATETHADPPHRLTLTFPVLNHAAAVHFLVSGAEKAEAVRCALAKTPALERCPAGGVRPGAGSLTWWLDQAAARLLDER